jgi:ribosomal protein S18 acetylase RimI-like enzyme
LDVKQYEVYFDGLTTPKLFADNHVVWPELRPGSEYSFRVAYQLSDGRHSELSALAFSKTWGRDYNADGLPDDWQREYFGKTVTTWPGAAADSDGDGATNGQEFAAGTDPSDKSDSLSVSLAKLERGQRLEWNARPGALYQLQHTAVLGSGSWAKLTLKLSDLSDGSVPAANSCPLVAPSPSLSAAAPGQVVTVLPKYSLCQSSGRPSAL